MQTLFNYECPCPLQATVYYQLVARAFNTQNRCGPRAFKRDWVAICQRLLIIFALASTGPLFYLFTYLFLSKNIHHSSNDNKPPVTLNATHPPPALPPHPPHRPCPQSQICSGTPVPHHSHAQGQWSLVMWIKLILCSLYCSPESETGSAQV